MHDGRFGTLEEVVKFYNQGGFRTLTRTIRSFRSNSQTENSRMWWPSCDP